jgi:hypothetical protein
MDFFLNVPAVLTPSYAAGEIFVENLLDVLLCQSYFNPYIIEIVRALVGEYYPTRKKNKHLNENDPFNRDDHLHLFPVLSIATSTGGMKTFGQVFCQALQQQVLVLGIYRYHHEGRNTRGNLLQYVYTCPKNLSCPIEKEDLLFVLTKKKMPISIG